MLNPKIKLVSVLLIGLAAPGFALANSLWHEAKGDASATIHPEHVQSSKTRAQVVQELQAAKADGSFYNSYYSLNQGVPPTVRSAGPGKTRSEVVSELVNMSDAERARMKELYSPN